MTEKPLEAVIGLRGSAGQSHSDLPARAHWTTFRRMGVPREVREVSFGAEPGRPGEAWAVFVGQTRPSARHRLSTPCPPGRSAGLLHIDAPPGVLHEPRLDAIEMPSAPGRTRMPFQGGGTARERRARHEVMSRGKRMCVPWHRGEIRSDRNRWVTLRAVGGGRLAARGRAGGGAFLGRR